MTSHFYKFLEPISKELANTLNELEGTIFSSPRTMLTHARTVLEAILEKVLFYEEMECEPFDTLHERIERLEDGKVISKEIFHALHEIRKAGNIAAHNIRQFRSSESLIAWEHLYTVIKWYVEVYASSKIEVPDYVEPTNQSESVYDLEEMQIRLTRLEELLKASSTDGRSEEKVDESEVEKEELLEKIEGEAPGLTTMRQIIFQDESVDIPHFLRDAFLLPHRFKESARYLLKLNKEQEARIMSELPADLASLPQLPRRNDSHKAKLLEELRIFIEEEVRRRNLIKERPGELFLFLDGEQIVVTEELGKVAINNDNFTGMPGLIDQLNMYGVFQVKDLPKELVTMGKYSGVGKGRIKNFFEQLVLIQQKIMREIEEEQMN